MAYGRTYPGSIEDCPAYLSILFAIYAETDVNFGNFKGIEGVVDMIKNDLKRSK